MDTGLRGGKWVLWRGLEKRTCRGAAMLRVCTHGSVTVTLRGVNHGGAPVTLRGGTVGGAPVMLRIGTLGGATGTLRNCKRVSESCWRDWFKGVAVELNGGAGPVCVMTWMRSLMAVAVRSEGVTCKMVYVERKKATLSLLRHALVAGI